MGWPYLAAVQDLLSRKIVGWALKERLTRELVIDAPQMAIDRRRSVWTRKASLYCLNVRAAP